MRIAQLTITNFRGIKNAKLDLDGHTLLIGMNNVGKSTLCEALDLVLGAERLSKQSAIEEFDFYNAHYLKKDDDDDAEIRVEVTLVDISDEIANKCAPHVQHWHREKRRVLTEGEVGLVDDQKVCECLRLRAQGFYNPEEDEFEARTVFVDGPTKPDGQLSDVPRNIKRLFGFLYLRALRTGSRALSLERGSLLDLILRQRGITAGIWEEAIQRLRGLHPPIDEGATALAPILENIEKRLSQYIPIEPGGRATQLFVSQLTREHLRKTITFFLTTCAGEGPVPFQDVGTGTTNTLVLALLTLLAEIKNNNVIFAMEEPEIALPPHTQRRIANYLLQSTTQCLVTSHSPYIVERFKPDQIQVLRKDAKGTVTATHVPDVLKAKTYRKHARRVFAEAMLGRGVIVAEGITEKDIILAAADVMETANPDTCYPIDLSGVTVLSVDGDGSLPEFGAFFKAMQIRAFGFFDKKDRKPEETESLKTSFDALCESPQKGSEALLVEEIPASRLWEFLKDVKQSGEKPNLDLPEQMPTPDEVKATAKSLLQNNKGSGYAGWLIALCPVNELPATVVGFLNQVYAAFPKPVAIPPIDVMVAIKDVTPDTPQAATTP